MSWLEKQIWSNYGECYAEASLALAESTKPDTKHQASEAARRALYYFIQTKDFRQINSVVQDLGIGPQTPQLNCFEFKGLSLFLQEKNINPDDIQAEIDKLIKPVRDESKNTEKK